jgi:phytoene dehydrogenase-like protein
MESDAPSPTVAVVGGGIAGLVAAVRAAERAGPGAVWLIEHRPLGGRARTDQRSGFTFGRGPRALYRGGLADRTLRELGVPVRTGGRPGLVGAGAVLAGRPHRFLLGGGAPLASTRALGRVLRGADAAAEGRTVTTWCDHLGLSPAVRAWIEAMVRAATYADAPDVLPASLALAQARAANVSGVQYLDGGFGSIVESLRSTAEAAGVVHVPAEVRSVAPTADGRVELVLGDARRISAASSVVCVGGPAQAAALLGHRPPSWDALGPPAEVACLELGIRGRTRYPFLLGIDEPTYLSQHAPPASLAPAGHRVVHLMRYLRPDAGDPLDAAAVRSSLRAVAARAGIGDDDIVEERFLARMTASTALPRLGSDGQVARPSIDVDGVPGVHVAGDWVGPDGLLLDAVVASADAAGRRAGERSATMAAT